jgi:glutathione synthase/RimK-type ligase-like ATP-grasp enzyme
LFPHVTRGQIRPMRVAIASCQRIPEPDLDEPLLLEALAGAGIDARVLAWDDDAAPFAEHDLVVLRSTWNYYQRVDDFVAWVARTGAATRVLNPPEIVAWNAKKTYLAELPKRGVDIVPTEFVLQGATRSVAEILDDRGWDDVVIKPVVSAGSFRTERFSRRAVPAAQAFLDALVADRDAMVQRWMPSVDTYGERSLVWVDGVVTHAIRKTPRFAGGSERVSGEVPIGDDERAFAERALLPFAAELLYARVDMVRDAEGTLRIMELELIEPSLFLLQSLPALDRLVSALARRAR